MALALGLVVWAVFCALMIGWIVDRVGGVLAFSRGLGLWILGGLVGVQWCCLLWKLS